jgi:heme exporter protein A
MDIPHQNMNNVIREKTPSAIKTEALTKRFGFSWALKGIDLTLNQGELLAIFGPNGAGKTTLIRILSTLMTPTSGKGRLLGYDLEQEGDLVRKSIGVLAHYPLLFPTLTAAENLKFYGQMFQIQQLSRRIEKLLDEVGLLEHRDQLVETFSRGMQQRLAIARAILHSPSLLLLDEPFTGLDQEGIDFLKQTLKDFLEQGQTIIMTSHDFVKGMELCTKAAILNNGHLVYYGVPSEQKGNFQAFYQRSISNYK